MIDWLRARVFGDRVAPDVIDGASHRALMAEKDTQIVRWEQLFSDMTERFEHMLALYEKATTPKEVASAPQVPLDREPSLVAQTIRELAQGDTRLSAYLHAEKRRLRSEHPRMSDEGIASLLSKFETSEELLDAGAAS